jgi:hypothetical protein
MSSITCCATSTAGSSSFATQAGYARLQRDPEAWAAYRAEIAELDGMTADGLDASA